MEGMNEWEEMAESQAEALQEGSQLRFSLGQCSACGAARHGGAEVKSKDCEPCSLDVRLSGVFTKVLGMSRTRFLSQACFQALLLIT